MDRMLVYHIIYALAAREGRDTILFGDSAPLAQEAFARSVAGDYFPELWFELPLKGEPWFDLHALVAHGDLPSGVEFGPETCGGNPEAFAWFAAQTGAARQLALSWDTGKGNVESPAVQLLTGTDDAQLTCDFLEVVRRPDAVSAYRAFTQRLPRGWFACYAGVFPQRSESNLRVECVLTEEVKQAFAEKPDVLEAQLRQVGVDEFGETLLTRCRALAQLPFQMEFQFDVALDGTLAPTVGASVRFAQPPGEDGWEPFDEHGAAGDLLQLVEQWGLADSRWRKLSETAFSKRVSQGQTGCVLYCFPTFVKLRWRGGEPLDAKAYLKAGALPAD